MEPVPSTASLARIFRDAGVARAEPKKKPRASYRRFVYPAPNACWQLDGTEYVLTGGRKCVIFQLIDDHSRLAVASHVAWGETSEGAITVVKKGISAHGVPQRLLSDNGAALNPSRRGVLGQLVAYVTLSRGRADHREALQADHAGQERDASTRPCSATSTSSPSPTRWSSCKPRSTRSMSSTTPSGPIKAFPGGSPRGTAWDATPKADRPDRDPDPSAAAPSHPTPSRAPTEIRVKKVQDSGIGRVPRHQVRYRPHATPDNGSASSTPGKTVMIFDLTGTLIIEHPWPTPGTNYVSNRQPRGPRKPL